jgi:transposase-like protein
MHSHLFIEVYEPQSPKATLCLQKDREELMAFFDFPAQHWQSIRTSNPIESAFPRSITAPSAQKAACHVMACFT